MMKFNLKQSILSATILLLASCGSKNSIECEDMLHNEAPAIKEYLIDHDIDLTAVAACQVVAPDSSGTMLHGITATDDEGVFHTDSSMFYSLTITKFKMIVNTENSTNRDIWCYKYDFSDSHEYNKFSTYHKSIGRNLIHAKEDHEFFEKNGIWYLYYFGMP